ncbi:hypothetical protein ZWY2020_008679 [Hordeum vulgare]|nr:hypothetical protein ZWY2020_008679 [Hordeum vulgare]
MATPHLYARRRPPPFRQRYHQRPFLPVLHRRRPPVRGGPSALTSHCAKSKVVPARILPLPDPLPRPPFPPSSSSVTSHTWRSASTSSHSAVSSQPAPLPLVLSASAASQPPPASAAPYPSSPPPPATTPPPRSLTPSPPPTADSRQRPSSSTSSSSLTSAPAANPSPQPPSPAATSPLAPAPSLHRRAALPLPSLRRVRPRDVPPNLHASGSRTNRVLQPTAQTFNSLLLAFYRHGKSEDFDIVLDRNEQGDGRREDCGMRWFRRDPADVTSYNTMIGGYCAARDMGMAEEMYKDMEISGTEPSVTTFEWLVRGHCRIGDVDAAMLVRVDLRRRGFDMARRLLKMVDR